MVSENRIARVGRIPRLDGDGLPFEYGGTSSTYSSEPIKQLRRLFLHPRQNQTQLCKHQQRRRATHSKVFAESSVGEHYGKCGLHIVVEVSINAVGLREFISRNILKNMFAGTNVRRERGIQG